MLAVRHLSTKAMDRPTLFQGFKTRDGGGCAERGERGVWEGGEEREAESGGG